MYESVWMSKAGFNEQDIEQHRITQNITHMAWEQHGQSILPINENPRDDPVEFSCGRTPSHSADLLKPVVLL